MLLVLRLLALAVGVGTAFFVLNGRMSNPLFQVADLVVGALLATAALAPLRIASGALMLAASYALGVFTVALADYVVPGRPINPLLILSMAIMLGIIVTLAFQPGGPFRSA